MIVCAWLSKISQLVCFYQFYGHFIVELLVVALLSVGNCLKIVVRPEEANSDSPTRF